MLKITEDNIWAAVRTFEDYVWRQDGLTSSEVAQVMGYVDEMAIKYAVVVIGTRLASMGFKRTSAPLAKCGPSMRWVYCPDGKRVRRENMVKSKLRDWARWRKLTPAEEEEQRRRFVRYPELASRTLPLSRLPVMQEALDDPYDYRGDQSVQSREWTEAKNPLAKDLRMRALLLRRLAEVEQRLSDAGWVEPEEAVDF